MGVEGGTIVPRSTMNGIFTCVWRRENGRHFGSTGSLSNAVNMSQQNSDGVKGCLFQGTDRSQNGLSKQPSQTASCSEAGDGGSSKRSSPNDSGDTWPSKQTSSSECAGRQASRQTSCESAEGGASAHFFCSESSQNTPCNESSRSQSINKESVSDASSSGSGSESVREQIHTYPLSQLKKMPECSMELDRLSHSPSHTVLIDTQRFRAGQIVTPTETQNVWDSNHVKLPHLYPKNPREQYSRWDVTHNALQGLIKARSLSAGDVEHAIMAYNSHYRKSWSFETLYYYGQRVHPQENYLPQVIPKMAKLALSLSHLIKQPIPLLRQQQSRAITLSQKQISCLLANAFFCTFPHRNNTQPGAEYATFPTINFSSLFGNQQKDQAALKAEKLRAILHYFNTVTDESPKEPAESKADGLVTFERISIPQSKLPDWKKQKKHLKNLHISPKGSIEKEGQGMLQVDFACKFIGGGVLGSGLVQEEILFLMSPELIVARLFTEKLADNECLKITGAQIYNLYTGYSSGFKWGGPYNDTTKRDEWKRRYRQIVAIDALHFRNPNEQYTKDNIKRELNKAYVGFKGDLNIPLDYTPAIATGNWGGGAFNGDPKLKALIQLMAAAVAERDMAYFAFGNEHLANDVLRMHHLLVSNKVTVDKLYQMLKDFCVYYTRERHSQKDLYRFIRERIGPKTSLL